MPSLKPSAIELTPAESKGLEQLIYRHSTRQQIALRARIVLHAAAGQNNAEVARALGVSLDAVRMWRQCWLSFQLIALTDLSVEARLEDLPRPS